MRNWWLIAMTVVVAFGTVAVPAFAASAGGNPEALLVQPEDFPVALPEVEGDAQENGYMALFLRSQTLAQTPSAPGELLGVMAQVELLDDSSAAAASFAGAQDADSVGAPAVLMATEPWTLETQQQPVTIPGAEEATLFQVRYEADGLTVVEHRYRLRVANAVAHLVVSARAADGGVEPPSFADQTLDVAARQTARLVAGLQ